MEILVFKTNITSKQEITRVEPRLNQLEGIIRWNIDLHDCDKILRVVSDNISPRRIEQQMMEAGHYCAELED